MKIDAAALPAPYVGGRTIEAIADIPKISPLKDHDNNGVKTNVLDSNPNISNPIAKAAIINQTSATDAKTLVEMYRTFTSVLPV